ncbi:MAG TPA: sugar ABC transporter permease [Phycisphaerae bacterium]|nr:sugar ABC transporter permease [Phycisphaerae bacterium]
MRSALRGRLTSYAFISPWLIALCFFIGFPFLAGLYFSFCDFPPLKVPVFIGLENYAELLGDARFHMSLGVTMVFAAAGIPIGVLLAITLAMFLNARIRGQSFYRVIFYIPHLVPTVVVAILWLWIFNPEFGLLNIVLAQVMRVVDGWAGVFFDLEAASAGAWFVKREALILLAAPLTLALTVWPAVPKFLRPSARLRQFLMTCALVLLVLALVPLADAVLHRVAPRDMAKLHAPGWLTDKSPLPSDVPFAPSWALWALIVMGMWGVGQMAVIYLAKLQDVPVELYEAADIDGANWLQKAWQITVPMISPVILFNVVMAIIGTFQVFAEPYIMTGGGPEDRTYFVALFVYDQAFQYQRVGYGSAVAWALFIMIVVLTILAFRLSRRHVYYAGR